VFHFDKKKKDVLSLIYTREILWKNFPFGADEFCCGVIYSSRRATGANEDRGLFTHSFIHSFLPLYFFLNDSSIALSLQLCTIFPPMYRPWGCSFSSSDFLDYYFCEGRKWRRITGINSRWLWFHPPKPIFERERVNILKSIFLFFNIKLKASFRPH